MTSFCSAVYLQPPHQHISGCFNLSYAHTAANNDILELHWHPSISVSVKPFDFGCSSGKVLGLTSMVHSGKGGKMGRNYMKYPKTFLLLWRKSSFTQITASAWRRLNLIIDKSTTVKWSFFLLFLTEQYWIMWFTISCSSRFIGIFYCATVNCLGFVLFCVSFLQFFKGLSKK